MSNQFEKLSNLFEKVCLDLSKSFKSERVVFESLHHKPESCNSGWYKLVSDKGPEWTVSFWGEPQEAINLAWKIAAPYAMVITVVGGEDEYYSEYWSVELERTSAGSIERSARENKFATLNRSWAHELACLFSREGVNGCVAKVSKWSRIRTIYEAGWVQREFITIPYVNGPGDWND